MSAKRPHPDDLERNGRSLVSAAGEKAGRSIGAGIWLQWQKEIRDEDAHPSTRYLVAFLRGYSEPLGGWLPEGMAEYLAERLDGAHPTPRGGRLPATSRDRFKKWTRELRLAEEALLFGLRETAERTGKHEVNLKKLLHRHRAAVLDHLEVELLNTRYPLPAGEAERIREALRREGRVPRAEGGSASD